MSSLKVGIKAVLKDDRFKDKYQDVEYISMLIRHIEYKDVMGWISEMTLVDLNRDEMSLIINLLKFNIDDLSLGSPNRRIPDATLKEWTNHIQSVIYKLEKAMKWFPLHKIKHYKK